MIDRSVLWTVIVVLGIGTFLLRFSFLGIIGNRAMPGWAVRALRCTAVAVLPGLVAPGVIWPQTTGGEPDPARLAAAAVTVLVGAWSRDMLAGMLSGAATLYGMLWWLG